MRRLKRSRQNKRGQKTKFNQSKSFFNANYVRIILLINEYYKRKKYEY